MSEYLLAILQENSLNQRNTGLKDADLLEIYEISVEVIALNEELNKTRRKGMPIHLTNQKYRSYTYTLVSSR